MKTHLPITTYPKNESLHERSINVSEDQLKTKEFKQLIRNMIHTMYKDDGIGIAAPQVGKNIRMAIIGKQALKQTSEPYPLPKRKDLVMINPTYIPLSTTKETAQEGCLSVLGKWGDVDRHLTVQVRFMTPDGKKHAFVVTDFLARVFQHEIDHLDGTLFIDKAKNVKQVKQVPTYPVV